MNINRLTVAALLTLLLNACATPLQPDNYLERIAATRLDLHRFVVGEPADSTDTDETTIDLTLLRSAEIALQHGFPYFVIVDPDARDDSAGSLQAAPVEISEYAGKRYRHVEPGASNTIICFENKPTGDAYVALFVKASLRNRYGLDQAGAAG